MNITEEDLAGLVPIKQYFDPANDHLYPNRIPRNLGQFYYLVNRSPDRSFIESGAAVKLSNIWHLNPKGVARWVEIQTEKTRDICA